MKRLAVSGIVSISLALALMAGGCGNSEEKKEVHSKSETVTEHAVTEHGHGADTHDKVREAIQAAHEAAMGMHEQTTETDSEKVEEATHTADEHASDVHEPVKKKMLEGC